VTDEPVDASRLRNRLSRERRARLEAEEIAERATRQLYDAVRQRDATAIAVAELLGAVAAAANQATSMGDALLVALDRVCQYTGWPVGHALVVSTDDQPAITSLGLWHLDDAQRYAAFRAKSESLRFTSGVGLPGKVLATSQPAWITNVAKESNFPRKAVAIEAGLTSAFAFPVIVRSDVRAVLEFFSSEQLGVKEDWLRVVAQIGAQLGRALEREEGEARLTRQGLYDELTGLPNRTLLMERIEHALLRAGRSGAKIDLLLLDIDDFKIINDSLGHTAGDEMLAGVAARLGECVRDSDTLARSSASTVARLGGDEFAILLEDCRDPRIVAERVAQTLRRPLVVMETEMFVSMSIGGASNETIRDAAELLRSADMALHMAKRGGKDRYEPFLATMQLSADRRLQLANELRRAVEGDQLRLHFQPELNLTDGRVIGVEALVRWEHPTHGMVPPGEFIPLAEESGLIVDVGRWVLREACRVVAAWGHDPVLGQLSVAVNVSGRQLREPGFAQLVAATLAETGLDPGRLLLEVTESVLMENDKVAVSLLEELRSSGIRLAVDDFGTGYSSLGALLRLPIDQLKIDRSFVQGLPADEDAGTIARAVVSLGHNLNLTVLAEGIETGAQLVALREFGCDLGQGFLFSRAVPDGDLQDVVAGLAKTAPALRKSRLPHAR
jgi:diguanylate cyclase (GGDEF)-like protein